MRHNLIFLFFLTLVIGCAAPAHIKEKAASILGPHCYAAFTNTDYFGYQSYVRHAEVLGAPSATVALAYAQDNPGGPEACGISIVNELQDGYLTSSITEEDFKNHAIAKCEKNKLNTSIKAACKIFALGNNIVWEKSEEIKLQ
jgi:hypothetical protein